MDVQSKGEAGFSRGSQRACLELPTPTPPPPAGEGERAQSKKMWRPGDVGHWPSGATNSKVKVVFCRMVTGSSHMVVS